MSGYLLGLDNGGTVLKAGIFDLNGKEIAVARENVEMLSPAEGHYQRNLEDVKDGNFKVIRKALEKAGLVGKDILAVSITGHGNGIYMINDLGQPTYDGISSADTRASGIVKKWYDKGIAKKILPYTLQSIWPGQPPAIMSWFIENNKEVLDKTRWILMVKDYIRFLLTGEIYVERTDISGTSIYNILEDRYDDRIFAHLGLSEYSDRFPEVRDPTDICGYITESVAEQTDLSAGTPVTGGLFDIQAATLATGIIEATEKPRLNIIVGTWSINQYVTNKPYIDEDLFMTSCFARKGNWLVTEGSATSASNLEWFISTFLSEEKKQASDKGVSIYDLCNDAIDKTSPEDTNILFLPFLFGDNTNSEINGTFLNLTMRHCRKHLIRAVYEGVVFSHRYHIDKLFKSYPEGLEAVLAGGGANSSQWAQMFSDILQIPVETTKCCELGALGAAMVAGVGVKSFKDLKDAANSMVSIKKRFEPDLSKKDIYEQKYQLYLDYIRKLS